MGKNVPHALQKASVEMLWLEKCEIEVLGKAISLEEALLQTGVTFRNPIVHKPFMLIDTGEHPAKDVVFLFNVWRERRLLANREDFRLLDHLVSLRVQL